jgi:DNA-binding CsgD family transcriptional regulator
MDEQSGLVGRQAEQATLRGWLAGRWAGPDGPPAALVSGEAGVGKTALVESVLAALPGPGAVLRGAGTPWHPAAFGVLRPAIPGWAGEPEPAALRAALLRAAAGQPVALFLDDLHWSDEASLDLLAGLAEAVAGDRVALIGVYRADELPRDHLLRRVRAGLRHGRRLVELPVPPLDAAAVSRLLAALLGAEPAPALADLVAQRHGGVSFFAAALVGALPEAGRLVPEGDRVALAPAPRLPLPETVRDAVLLRVAQLPAGARAVLSVAAVVGGHFDVHTVTALAGAAGWPDELDHCGLVTMAEDGAGRFRHVLAQEAVYADIPWSRRRALHLAVAARISAGRPGADLLVARHLLAGHDFDRARAAFLTAAAAAMRVHAYRDAARALREALDLWRPGTDDPGRLAATDRLARCAELTGEHTEAVSLLRELADGYREEGALATVHRRLALRHELLGQWPRALAAREQAAAAFAAAGQPAEAATERLAAAAHLRSAASFRAALEVLELARADAAGAARTDLLARIDGLHGNVLCRMGRPGEGVPSVRAALDLALSHGLSGPAAELYQRLADSLEHAGDYRAAGQAYDSAYQYCAAHGDTATGELCQACATVVLFHSGRWPAAARRCREVLAAPAGGAHARAVAAGVLGLVQALRGQPDPARSALLECRSVAVRIDLVAMELLATWGLALLEEAAGHAEGVAEEYRRVLRRVEQTEERHYCVPVLLWAAGHFAGPGPGAAAPGGPGGPGGAPGGRGELSATAAALARIAEATGQPEARAALAYALGEAADSADAALAQYRHALDLLEGLDLPLLDSQIRYRTGVAQLATGDPAAGTENLRRAHRTLHRLGARPLAERVRRLLTPAGAAGAPGAGAPRPDLTARELQVLRLVALGHTSREIGRQLYLSTRTIEMHVQNAMARLGCRTRAEAVRRLTQLNLAEPPPAPAGDSERGR